MNPHNWQYDYGISEELGNALTLTGKGAVMRSLDLEDGVGGRGLWEAS